MVLKYKRGALVALIVLVGPLGFFLALRAVMPKAPEAVLTTSTDTSIRGSSNAVQSVEIDGSVLHIAAALRTENVHDYVELASKVLEAVAKRLREGGSDDVTAVQNITVVFVSNHGAPLMTVGYSADRLRAAPLDQLGSQVVLGLADRVMLTDQDAAFGVAEWCATQASSAPSFCRSALSK